MFWWSGLGWECRFPISYGLIWSCVQWSAVEALGASLFVWQGILSHREGRRRGWTGRVFLTKVVTRGRASLSEMVNYSRSVWLDMRRQSDWMYHYVLGLGLGFWWLGSWSWTGECELFVCAIVLGFGWSVFAYGLWWLWFRAAGICRMALTFSRGLWAFVTLGGSSLPWAFGFILGMNSTFCIIHWVNLWTIYLT